MARRRRRTGPRSTSTLWALHVRYARDRDDGALQTLVDRYRPHAEAQARRLYRRGEPIDDLTQVAYEALMLALRRFDPERGKPFLAFAKPTIVGLAAPPLPGRRVGHPGPPPGARAGQPGAATPTSC